MPNIKTLYNGWPLVYQPNSPAAIELLSILARLPQEVAALVALPGVPFEPLPDAVEQVVTPTPNQAGARLRWEQCILPRQQRDLGAAILHTSTGFAPLFSGGATVVSPSGYRLDTGAPQSLAARLRSALGRGGLARSAKVLWPEDMPAWPDMPAVEVLPPVVHPAFVPADDDDLPEIAGLDEFDGYVLYHGPQNFDALLAVLQTWQWAADAVGDSFPLLLVGLDTVAEAYVDYYLSEYELAARVQLLPNLPLAQLAAVTQHASVVFQPMGLSPWGGAVRAGIACGRVVVAPYSADLEQVCGPAAYLPESAEPRQLAGGLIAALIKEQVAIDLERSAAEWGQRYQVEDFGERLLAIYRSVIG